MKILPAILLLFSLSSQADVLNITHMQKDPNFELQFIMKEKPSADAFIRLDCQSFIQKIDFYSQLGVISSENYISIDECEFLYNKTKKCIDLGKAKCFDSNNIFNESCDC